MADLLSQNREASARIRVENIIHADITVELMGDSGVVCGATTSTGGTVGCEDKNIKDGIAAADDETGLEEAACSMIYAAPRLPRDVRELGTVRAMLVERFGKDFAVKANENEGGVVPARVSDKLRVDPPKKELVQAYLEEIARAYGVDWPRMDEKLEEMRAEVGDEEGDDSDGVGGGMTEEADLGGWCEGCTDAEGRIRS